MKETFFWTFSSDEISTLSDLTSEGFEGVMMCLSKTALLDYYVRRYGCSRIANTDRVMFHTAACQLLIDRFLKEGVANHEDS